MATYNRPSALPEWCFANTSNCTDAPTALSEAGFTQGSVPVAEYENSYRRNIGLWLGYLDQATTKQVLTSALNLDLRLTGGGTFTYTPATSTLAWDDTLYLSVPGIPQTDNAIAAGSVTLGSQTLAYVQANIPFTTQASVTSGDAQVRNVLSTSAITAGQAVSGPGIPSGTTVASISDSTVTLSQAATDTNQTASLTFVGTGALTVQSTTTQSFTPAGNSVVIAIGMTESAIVGANCGQMTVRPLEAKRLLGTGFANTIRLPAGQALTPNQACFIASGQGGLTAGAAYPCDASSANGAVKAKFAGFANTSVASASFGHIVSNGIIGGFTGLTIGATYWLDPATTGGITATKPTTAGQYAVPVGQAVSTTQLQVNSAAGSVAAQVAAAARVKISVELGTAFTRNNNGTAVLKSGYDPNTGGIAYYIYNFTPDYQGSVLQFSISSNGVSQQTAGSAQDTPYIQQNPGYGSSRSGGGYIWTGGTPTQAMYGQQSVGYTWALSPGQVILYPDCSYSFTVSTGYSTANQSLYHNCRMVIDQPA